MSIFSNFVTLLDKLGDLKVRDYDEYYNVNDSEVKDIPILGHEGILGRYVDNEFSYYYCLPGHPFARFAISLQKSIFGYGPCYTDIENLHQKNGICFFFDEPKKVPQERFDLPPYIDTYSDPLYTKNDFDVTHVNNVNNDNNNNNYLYNNSGSVNRNNFTSGTTYGTSGTYGTSTTYETSGTYETTTQNLEPQYVIVPNSEILTLYVFRTQIIGQEFSLTQIITNNINNRASDYIQLKSYLEAAESSKVQKEILNNREKLELLSSIMDGGHCKNEELKRKYDNLIKRDNE